VFFIKEWALFFGQLFASILTVIYYKLKAPYKMHFLFSKKQAFFLFKTRFFLSIAWVLWGAFKFIDKTVISIYLPEFELGLFTFALTFIYFFYNAMLDFGNVLMPILWRAWSDKNPFEFKNISKKYAYFFSISSGLLIPVFQIGYYFIVSFLVKDFATKDNFFNVLTLNLFFLTIVILPNIMLASKNINKQYFTAITHFIGIIANIILCILLIKAGYSLLGVAIAATVTQSIISIFQYGFSLKYFEDGITKKIIFVFKLFLPFIINVLLLLLQMLLQKLCNNRIIFMILHASAVAIVFIPVLFFVYPEVIRFSEIKRMFKDKKV